MPRRKRTSNSRAAWEATDTKTVEDCVLAILQAEEDRQLSEGQMVGLAGFELEQRVAEKLGELPAQNVRARLTELDTRGAIRVEGNRLNPRSGHLNFNYRLTHKPEIMPSYVPRRAAFRELVLEAAGTMHKLDGLGKLPPGWKRWLARADAALHGE